jgi:predicted MFS family arabinose efflux permease
MEGWGMTIAVLGVSAILWVLFVTIERSSNAPLVRFGILRTGSLVRVNLAALLFAAAFFGFQFIASLYLQELLGWTPLQTSLTMLAIGVDLFLAPTVTPWLVQRFGNMRVILGGLLLAAASYALFLRLDFDWTYAAMFPSMLLLGLAFALAYGPITIAATDGVAEKEQGIASGLVNTAFQFGAALGLSATSAVSVLGLGADASPEAALEGMRMALAIPLAAIVIAAALVATGLRECPADAECVA